MQKSKTAAEIQHMRTSGRILAEVLQAVSGEVAPGVTTGQLDAIAVAEIAKRQAKAAFLGYNGFPASICISINDEVVHGIPGERVINDGDLVGLDLGINYKDMITDGAITISVGAIDDDKQRLLDGTRGALEDVIPRIKAGVRVGDVSAAIESFLHKRKLTVIEDLSGHGVGHSVHEDPMVPNFGKPGRGPKLVAGMTIAIEPMASLGGKDIDVMPDDWTIRTVDGSLAAQFEHTILVTETGAEILTQI